MTAPFLIATRSPGKRKEIVQILRDIPYRLVFPEDVGLVERAEEAGLETADSFEGNARRKAEYFARLSGVPTAADDSGLEVFSLGGQPGVRSHRFAIVSGPPDQQDAANNAELLRRLAGAPAPRRRARYRCVIAYFSRPDAIPMTFEGTCLGSIAQAPRGGGGFGYDPLFVSDDLGKTFGEATPEEKHAVSHRGRAFRALAQWLQTHLTG
ncbi:MAG: non-canonical purine NTP pyrophosphatase [Gemmatimonadetes bacterium]|nr:non-canonical purine NTP pyrophosphatase [Gemmatimonadota bacterium]